METTSIWGIIARLVLAVILGGIIGYQRERSEKPAGLRTHALVCLGSALMTIVSINIEPILGMERTDVTRIASSVVTGIGFLGGGAIIRQGNIVRGLTTAASIWVVSGVGLAVGAGLYSAAIAATVFILLTLTALVYIELAAIPGHRTVQMKAVDTSQQVGVIVTTLNQIGVTVDKIDIDRLEGEDASVIQIALQIPNEIDSDEIISTLASIKGINQVHWITKPIAL